METWKKVLVGLVVVLVLGGVAFWGACLNHVEINHIGVAYDSISGDVWKQEKAGWYVTSPFVRVANISTLPMKVTIPSEARVIVTKVVRFNESGFAEFIRMQGFSYSFSSSLANILLGYAFSGEQYPFLEILQEAGEEKLNTRPLGSEQKGATQN